MFVQLRHIVLGSRKIFATYYIAVGWYRTRRCRNIGLRWNGREEPLRVQMSMWMWCGSKRMHSVRSDKIKSESLLCYALQPQHSTLHFLRSVVHNDCFFSLTVRLCVRTFAINLMWYERQECQLFCRKYEYFSTRTTIELIDVLFLNNSVITRNENVQKKANWYRHVVKYVHKRCRLMLSLCVANRASAWMSRAGVDVRVYDLKSVVSSFIASQSNRWCPTASSSVKLVCFNWFEYLSTYHSTVIGMPEQQRKY